MSKILNILGVLLIGFAIVPAQVYDANVSKNGSTDQVNYSESTPYQPRETISPDSKTKKEKKSKKNQSEKTAFQPENLNLTKTIGGNRTVQIPVFVYDQKGKPVTDLQSSDLKLFVGGEEREFASFETVKKPLNLLLILDTSPSLAYKPEDLRNVAAKLTEALKPEDKLQIVVFNENLKVLTEPTNDPQTLQKAVKKIQMGEGTSIYETVQKICQAIMGNAAEMPTIILLTDGVDTTSRKADYRSSLIAAEKTGATVFPFYFDSYNYFKNNKTAFPVSGFGINTPQFVGQTKEEYDLGRAYLQDIASLSGINAFVLNNLTDIKKEDFEAAFKFLNPQYYITLNSTENAGNFGRKQIKVRVNRPNLKVMARGSFVFGE
jgi:VWFA-related protein